MLTPLNRAQLAAVFQQDRCQEIVRILDQHNIPSQVRTMDRTSPSVFSHGHPGSAAAPFSRTPPRAGSTSSMWPGRTWKPPGPSPGWMESGRRQRKI